MNKDERIKELEYLNNEHRGVIGILMDEREVLRERIAELEKENEKWKTSYDKLAHDVVLNPSQTNAEPVAWMHKNPNYPISKHSSLEYNIPLYTTPQTKPLSDEEIRQCILDYFESDHYKLHPLPYVSVQFARAIEERHGIK